MLSGGTNSASTYIVTQTTAKQKLSFSEQSPNSVSDMTCSLTFGELFSATFWWVFWVSYIWRKYHRWEMDIRTILMTFCVQCECLHGVNRYQRSHNSQRIRKSCP
ncbi:unnamed protein product [Allacma fusca]|uniref:Uncharacterized protein n=1 Tax=Allacma fusca TaxID=39272 RepID=A0A8J2JSZ6_9HEXA|nr:unnamed protein product [Allacma fusca]